MELVFTHLVSDSHLAFFSLLKEETKTAQTLSVQLYVQISTFNAFVYSI